MAASSATWTRTFPCGSCSSPSASRSSPVVEPAGPPVIAPGGPVACSALFQHFSTVVADNAFAPRRSPSMTTNNSRHRRNLTLGILFVPLAVLSSAMAQGTLQPTPQFPLSEGPFVIRQAVQPQHPFTVTGATGAILGLQNGSLEMWALPTKVFSGLHLTAEPAGYPWPLRPNAAAAAIDVPPDHTTITYSHAALTVRPQMFVPSGECDSAKGAMSL